MLCDILTIVKELSIEISTQHSYIGAASFLPIDALSPNSPNEGTISFVGRNVLYHHFQELVHPESTIRLFLITPPRSGQRSSAGGGGYRDRAPQSAAMYLTKCLRQQWVR